MQSRWKSFMINPLWPNLSIWRDAWLFYFLKKIDDEFTFAMLDWLNGRSLLALKKDGFHHLIMICLFLLIGGRSGLVSKGRTFWPDAFSILQLPKKGGRVWPVPRLFWWNWPSIFIVCKLPTQLVPNPTKSLHINCQSCAFLKFVACIFPFCFWQVLHLCF